MCTAWVCVAVQAGGDTPGSLTATQGLAATHTGGASAVHRLVTVTLPAQGLDVTHRPGTRCPEPCPSPTVTLRSAGVTQPGAESGQVRHRSHESRLEPPYHPHACSYQPPAPAAGEEIKEITTSPLGHPPSIAAAPKPDPPRAVPTPGAPVSSPPEEPGEPPGGRAGAAASPSPTGSAAR